MAGEYIVCVPSYKRSKVCNTKTLQTLKDNGIPRNKIYVYVANDEEYEIYENELDRDLYNKLYVGIKGLVPVRQFIMDQWGPGKHIVFLDDDISNIDLSLSPRFKSHSLDFFFRTAFQECQRNKSYIWGVYPVFNPFFRKDRAELSTDLTYIVGAFYGIINRPSLKDIQLTITKENGQKEDVERTIKYFIKDGIVLRFNKVGFNTIYYGKEGGLGTFEERLKPMKIACELLARKYPEYGTIKVRKNGMTEFAVRKIKAHTKPGMEKKVSSRRRSPKYRL